MRKQVADILVEELVKNGITDCFAVVGGGAIYLDHALAAQDGMHTYFNHHEQACAMAAEAYARLSGKMACVCVTSGPGALNTLNGVAGAWEDSIPMIVVSGQVRYATSVEKSGLPLRCRGIQEFEILDSVQNMTKYAVKVKEPRSIRSEVKKAITIAMSGRRGPVWLDMPLDIQSTYVEEEALFENAYEAPKIRIHAGEIQEMEEAIIKAERPCILAGSAIISSNVREEFQAFIANVQVPVVGGAMLADLLPVDYTRYYGMSGNIGPRAGNFILQNADLILVLGSSLSFRQTGFNQEGFAPGAKIIMVDIDENEPQKPGLSIGQFIHADLRDFFAYMQGDGFTVSCLEEWIDYCNMLKQRFSVYEGKGEPDPHGRVGQYCFWEEYDQMVPDDMITALGNNTAICAKLQTGIRKMGQKVIANYTIGSMGYDLPAAIGAAVVSQKSVICVTGDGSIMMNLQELQTIRHYGLPIKVIVFSNEGYNAIRQTCKNLFHGVVFGCSPETGVSFPDFPMVAKTFGFEYRCCSCNSEIRACIEWVLSSEGNVFLEVKEKYDDPLIPKVMSKTDANGAFVTPALHDMAPLLQEDELHRLMLGERT